jgi:hypothetical protein
MESLKMSKDDFSCFFHFHMADWVVESTSAIARARLLPLALGGLSKSWDGLAT